MSESIPEYATSFGMRVAAEAASAIRRKGLPGEPPPGPPFLATRYDPKIRDWVTDPRGATGLCSSPGVLVTPVDTLFLQPDRREVAAVSIQPADGETADLMCYDAVFWSESAVEKFVLSYYASKYQWAAAFCLTTLAKVFYGYVPDVLPTNRPPPGASAGRTLRYEGPDGTTIEHEAIPFAVGHLPRSDYAGIDPGAPPPAHELWFLFREAGGTRVVHRPLADFFSGPTEAPR